MTLLAISREPGSFCNEALYRLFLPYFNVLIRSHGSDSMFTRNLWFLTLGQSNQTLKLQMKNKLLTVLDLGNVLQLCVEKILFQKFFFIMLMLIACLNLLAQIDAVCRFEK
ncbi:hypothetical protein T10_13629 [Trichinella papuae]|uniref:Uncharacterized protein n=1 Tax=Trichinella papuae TaxID=268474 RepID=A0A0V1MR72_9BILA|nr:hypothetical protein T10_13629 [Trichinella papuae]